MRPVDVTVSVWNASLEDYDDHAANPAIRLGLREIGGLSPAAAERIVAAREQQPFRDVQDLCHRARLDRREQALMAESGALLAIAGNRNAARWQVAGVEQQRPLFAGSPQEDAIELPAPTVAQDLLADYATVGLTLGAHPLSLVRHHLAKERCIPSDELVTRRSGSRVRVAGLVTLRQRPETAKGTTFVTLEDEAGNVQVIVQRHDTESA